MVTICIPSKTERFLKQTTRAVLEKATGEIEVIVILDGYNFNTDYQIEIKKKEQIKFSGN